MPAEPASRERLGNFAPQDAPGYGDILNCMHCGLCLPTCPTYSLTGRERSSPRGRIQLMRGVSDGRLSVTERFSQEMYFCLGCLACETACPAGVPYGSLLEAARTQVAQLHPSKPLPGLARRLAFLMFEYPALLRLLGVAMRLYQRTGLRRLVHRLGLLKAFGALGEMERLLPELAPQPSSRTIPEVTPAVGEQRHRVGVLLGCVMDVLCAKENEATVRVLARQGCEVVAPHACGCCGALHAHAGEMGKARELARQVIATFETTEVDQIVLNSAGCGAAMKDYAHWFHDDPVWAERAAALSAKVVDLTEWLATHGLRREGLRPLHLRVTYHDACHLNHAQGVSVQPREVLRQLPGIHFVELPEAGWCCGSAGIYNVTHFTEAVQLLDRKMANLAATGAEVVVTGNPGCLIQLQYGVERSGLATEAVHTAVLLDRAYGDD